MANPHPQVEFAAQLADRLSRPLPGRAAQQAMSHSLAYGRHFGPPARDVRRAAVTVLLYPDESGRWMLPLTVRAATLEDHAGQISLPGGVVEPGESDERCAVRELSEELGVSTEGLQLLGRLSPLYLYVSNFEIAPWVAALPRRPEFAPNAGEVAELLEAPLAYFLDAAAVGRHDRIVQGISFSVPHYTWGDHVIWGATSMVLAELAAVVGEVRTAPRA